MGSSRRLSGLAVVLLLALAGCGRKEEGLVLKTPSVVASPILRSEADQVVIPLRVDAPITFENRSSVEQTFSVLKTGCSCYGMATAEAFLEAGEPIRIPPGATKDLFFVAKELQAESEQAFRVGFQVETGAEPAIEELRANGSMKIYPDLVIDPASVVVDLPAAGDNEAETENHSITITQVTRGKPAESAGPVLTMSPSLLTSEPARRDRAPEEISPGLWRTVWVASLKLEPLPPEIRENGGRFAFSFEFPDAQGTPTEPGSLPRDGEIPTILDVVGRKPQRIVTGQLILRRSKGIIAPAQLHFGSVPAGSGVRTRRLVLTAADHRPFQVTIGDLPSQFAADADSNEPAEQQWVTVTFQPGDTGDSEGKLTLKTTHPDQPEVQVTLKARVR